MLLMNPLIFIKNGEGVRDDAHTMNIQSGTSIILIVASDRVTSMWVVVETSARSAKVDGAGFTEVNAATIREWVGC